MRGGRVKGRAKSVETRSRRTGVGCDTSSVYTLPEGDPAAQGDKTEGKNEDILLIFPIK